MAVQCAHCGEELLGSVNRCWKCGRSLIAHAGPAELPPVRRAPIIGALDAPLAAILLDEPSAPNPQVAPLRKGSPFATSVSNDRLTKQARFQNLAVVAPPLRSNLAANLAGRISIALGVMAFAVGYPFWPGGLGIAVAGIGFGIWSLVSKKRYLGTTGLILSFAALAVAIYWMSRQ